MSRQVAKHKQNKSCAVRKEAEASIARRPLGKYCFIIFLVFLVCYLYVQLHTRAEWQIDSVRIEGSFKHLSKAAIQDELMPLVDRNFFEIDVNAIRFRLLEMPWVANAHVRRVWPNKLDVKITEQKAVAEWDHVGLFNKDGQFFQPNVQTFPTNLVQLSGPLAAQDLVWRNTQKMTNILRGINLQIKGVSLSERHTWELELTNGMQILLGRTNVIPRLQHFVAVFHRVFDSQAQQANKIAVVDMRYTNGMALSWHQKPVTPG